MGRPSSICRACLPGREGASTELLQQLSGQSGRRTAQQKLRKALPDQAPSSSTEAGQILSGFKACWGWYTLHEKKTSGVKAMLYQDPLSSTEAGHILLLSGLQPAGNGVCCMKTESRGVKCFCRPLSRRVVLDSIAGQDKKTAPPATPFANCQLQDQELLSVEGNKLGDRLPGPLWPLKALIWLQSALLVLNPAGALRLL